MSDYLVSLDYQLTPGWLQPYIDGLAKGKAKSWRCADCERTSFPPVRTCTCGQTSGAWTTLSGEACVVHYTFGHDGAFALARFNGADTAAVVRLHSIDNDVLVRMSDARTKELTATLQPSGSEFSGLVVKINSVSNTT